MADVPSAAKTMEIKVAKVIDDLTLVINKGSDDGLKEGQRFLVYAIGEEIFDPETKESLGRLETVKGTGKIIHLQSKIATLVSDMESPPGRTIRRYNPLLSDWSLLNILNQPAAVEEVLPTKPVAFSSPAVGDFVKKV